MGFMRAKAMLAKQVRVRFSVAQVIEQIYSTSVLTFSSRR